MLNNTCFHTKNKICEHKSRWGLDSIYSSIQIIPFFSGINDVFINLIPYFFFLILLFHIDA